MALGRVEAADDYTRAITESEECTLIESMPVRMIKMRILMNFQSTYSKVIDYGLALLKQLEFSLVWSRALVKVQALKLAFNTIKNAKRLPVSHFASLEKMKDPKQQAIANPPIQRNGNCYP